MAARTAQAHDQRQNRQCRAVEHVTRSQLQSVGVSVEPTSRKPLANCQRCQLVCSLVQDADWLLLLSCRESPPSSLPPASFFSLACSRASR